MATSSDRILKNSELRPSILKERHALLQRVLWSHQIGKSGRIRDFLVYVCERAVQEPSAEIHEQEIGSRVFGRSGDYDTTVDNIVRVTASQARKRLEQYFASEGASEPVVLEIPKGKYTPVFRERGQPEAETSAAPESQVQVLPARRSRAVHVLAVCTVVLAILIVWLAVNLRRERLAALSELDTSPALNALWSQLIPRDGRTDIVVPDSSLSLFQELLDHQLTLSQYLKFGDWTAGSGLSSNPALQIFAQRAAQRDFTSMASVTTAYRIAQLVRRDQTHISIFSARDFNTRAMKFDNVILLGSIRANPWAELIEDRLNFRFGFDQKSRYSYFENLAPRPGEPKMYQTDSSVSYCRIAFLPNLSRSGNILSVSGTETEGTEGGGDFVTNEHSIAQLLALAGVSHGNRLPYFEALLKSGRVGGAPESPSIVALRMLKP